MKKLIIIIAIFFFFVIGLKLGDSSFNQNKIFEEEKNKKSPLLIMIMKLKS